METICDAGYRDELARLTPSLRRFARALVRHHLVDVADDLVQATLTRALGGDQGRRGTRLHVWLVSILVGLHRDQVRDLGAEQRIGSASDAATPTGQPWKSGRRDVALLGSIPVEYRESLLLVVLEGMSYAQVAECLGLSAATVATRVARARDYLARAQAGWSGGKPAVAGARTTSHLRLVK
ncbi:sigma-70 family RNA polymerase sigma factor [Lichenihabitans sp. Uapishka_5]|uniref:sigma-70 family RNA polymerase sigma factor n=1 Tax=Lichenihabitans sp. Uapishka_5 TaxID=3037302 RepID=UPI0029E80D1F|nr:sigma-70 family RNA polymerase sigma factor [Lichenihabitans sp. Uapishka_5]MDX7951897.1 sigma-70 family RNA polymerase sigma factor [Lichenihabitans sp. Uapishka_5]